MGFKFHCQPMNLHCADGKFSDLYPLVFLKDPIYLQCYFSCISTTYYPGCLIQFAALLIIAPRMLLCNPQSFFKPPQNLKFCKSFSRKIWKRISNGGIKFSEVECFQDTILFSLGQDIPQPSSDLDVKCRSYTESFSLVGLAFDQNLKERNHIISLAESATKTN